MTEWIISDTHFGHENIIHYASRPFSSLGEMDTAMIHRWCGSVGPDDIVYHLGDVGKTSARYNLAGTIARLPGRKILIRGNHDKNPESMRNLGFDVVLEEAVIRCDGMSFRLIHRPQPASFGQDYTLHGHIHNSTPEERIEYQHRELVNIPSFNINMCVEKWNYTPVSLHYLVKQLRHKQHLTKS